MVVYPIGEVSFAKFLLRASCATPQRQRPAHYRRQQLRGVAACATPGNVLRIRKDCGCKQVKRREGSRRSGRLANSSI